MKVRILDKESLYYQLLYHYKNYVKDATENDIKIDYFEENEDGTIECWYNKEYSISLTNDIVKKEVEQMNENDKHFIKRYEELDEYTKQLEYKLQQKENIIKEVREYIEKDMEKYGGDIYITCKDILEILDKGKE